MRSTARDRPGKSHCATVCPLATAMSSQISRFEISKRRHERSSRPLEPFEPADGEIPVRRPGPGTSPTCRRRRGEPRRARTAPVRRRSPAGPTPRRYPPLQGDARKRRGGEQAAAILGERVFIQRLPQDTRSAQPRSSTVSETVPGSTGRTRRPPRADRERRDDEAERRA